MIEFKDNKPLPNHTKLDYYECYAKIVLEEMFPRQFSCLIILDKPDLQNEQLNIGVEVTSSIDQKQRNAESLYIKWSYQENTDKEKIKEEIKKCGAELVGGILSGIPDHDDFNRVYIALKDKLERLSSGQYKIFGRQCLFVFSTIYATSTMREEALKDMNNICSNAIRKFDEIYILVPGAIYIFDLVNNTTFEREINNIRQTHQAQCAREMVVLEERGQY